MNIRISDFPQLRLIAWNRRDNDILDGEEALALYERNWHHIDQDSLTEKERQLIEDLAKEFGKGLLHV